MSEDTASLNRRQMLRRVREEARATAGNNALACIGIIGFGVAIAAIAPVSWGWKIALFLMIMFLVGVIMPVIGRARRNSD
jgi:hypothetical protein